jgi:predicted acylesterase/phospholipase RssA
MQAVDIDGAYNWNGMYSGNPAIYPLVYECESRDILLVRITPAERPGVPKTSPAIMNRMQEISCNASLKGHNVDAATWTAVNVQTHHAFLTRQALFLIASRGTSLT